MGPRRLKSKVTNGQTDGIAWYCKVQRSTLNTPDSIHFSDFRYQNYGIWMLCSNFTFPYQCFSFAFLNNINKSKIEPIVCSMLHFQLLTEQSEVWLGWVNEIFIILILYHINFLPKQPSSKV